MDAWTLVRPTIAVATLGMPVGSARFLPSLFAAAFEITFVVIVTFAQFWTRRQAGHRRGGTFVELRTLGHL